MIDLFSNGLAVVSNLEILSPFAKLVSDLTITEAPQLHLQSKVELSGGPALCMQLTQPNSSFKKKISNILTVPETSFKMGKTINVTYRVAGKSHALNRKNNEMCNRILEE
jgi:microsomal triglyceride transfer protein large subunit